MNSLPTGAGATSPVRHRRLGALSFFGLLCGVVSFASAATRTVTNLNDTGTGSLRKTIDSAVAGDTIVFSASLFTSGALPKQISLGSALRIDKSLTIVGPGDFTTTPGIDDPQGPQRPKLALRSCGTDRVLEVRKGSSTPTVKISGITFTGGNACWDPQGGGGILLKGGAKLTLERCDVIGNRSYFGGGIAAGWLNGPGGATLTLIECRIADNCAPVNLVLKKGGRGGGIAGDRSTITIVRSLIAGNDTEELGPCIEGNYGGGLYAAGGTVTVDNSTFAGNSSSFGGAAAFVKVDAAASATFTSCTIVDNVAEEHASGAAMGGGLAVKGTGCLLKFKGSIITRNLLLPVGGGAPVPADLAVLGGAGAITSLGYNVVGSAGGFTPVTGDQVGVDPTLGPLADNGGRTFTFALLDNSPAFNAGDPAIAPSPSLFDQRGTGFPRVAAQPVGARIDAGAYEFVDTTPPEISLIGDADQSFVMGSAFVDSGYLASDNHGSPWVTRTVNGSATGDVNTCALGDYVLVYTATDSFGNTSAVTRVVHVVAPPITITVPALVDLLVDPGYCLVKKKPSDLAAITGLPVGCPITITALVEFPGEAAPLPFDFYELLDFPLGESFVTVTVTAPTNTGGSAVIASQLFSVLVGDPYNSCVPNVAWPLAEELELLPLVPGGNTRTGVFPQMLTVPGESRWFKFFAAPGGQIDITLTNLPANYDLNVFSDIQAAYDELAGLVAGGAEQQALGLLGTEFAGGRRSPEAYSPDDFAAPEAYSPDAFAARKMYSPEAYSPDGYAAPEAYSPDVFAAPEAYSPENLAARGISAPEAYSPDAYSAAQQRSLIAWSASPGTISEGIRFNTYTTGGMFYIRIRGQQGVYTTDEPFDLTVSVTDGLCNGVTDQNTTPASTPVIAGAPTSLFVWDSSRITGTPAQLAALETSLAQFAAAANGAVVDVADDSRIVALNAQADANPFCPLAKNLVADAIRNLILAVRATHPTIADITLVGNDDVIPFFRTDDEANLGNEILYYPPVFNSTQSQTALRYNQVLTQDRYGSDHQVVLASGPYDLPEIPVARLVETATEVKDYLDAYLPLFSGPTATGGVLPVPASGYVAAYDFMADSGAAIQAEFAAALGAGGSVEALISAIDVPPSDGWTADELRTGFLGTRRDLAHLAAHFSTSTALAADYLTRFKASELAASAVNLQYALILSNGCHSGYNTVDEDAIPGLTDQPDWAQAFARKRALWVSGTGYQYGDTDFIDYTERLLLEYVQTLRLGTGPVPIGRALVEAKRAYLAETPLMRGIHEKSLLQLTLYGLPMVKLDLPGRLVAPAAPPSEVTSTAALAGPGAAHSLRAGNLLVTPALTRVDQTFAVLDSAGTVVVSYFTGSDGFVPVSGEPIRPLESASVHRPLDGFVRGLGFRGGSYTDTTGFRPFTGAPGTELSTVHGKFVSPTFFPLLPWNLNQLGFLTLPDGYTVANVFPMQFRSNLADPEDDTGTARTFGPMQFTVYYCPEVSTDALANAPALNLVTSEVDAGGVHVTVEAAATTGAGVQEVWLCFTGLPGSPYYGAWQSFTLAGPGNATGIGEWTGTLPLASGTDASLIQFFVQAVNGFGSVSSNTNVGRMFGAGTSTLDGIGATSAPTSIAFVGTPAATGKYGEIVPLQARLADGADAPLAGKTITFKLGSAARSAVTNALGIATVNLRLNTPPADYDLNATFVGDIVYRNATATRPFSLARQVTTLTLSPDGAAPGAAHIFATLTAPGGAPLKERTVIFLADNGATTTAIAEITNGAGVARLAPDALPVGVYTVTASFGQTVTLPDSTVVELADPLYEPSQDTGAYEVLPFNQLTLTKEKVVVLYGDKTAPGATTSNKGHSQTDITAALGFTDVAFDPQSIPAAPSATTMKAHVRAVLANQQLFDGDVTLSILQLTNRQWTGFATIGGVKTSVCINWLPPSFRSVLSDPTGPKLETTTLTPTLTLLTYTPVAGTYATTIGSGAGSAVVTVTNGKVTKITGGITSQCKILTFGKSAIVALPFAIKPGDTVVTAGAIARHVVVTAGVNYFGSTGLVAIQVGTPAGFGPLFNATPAILECELTLGSGPGEKPFAATLIVGDALKPWTTQYLNSRTRICP